MTNKKSSIFQKLFFFFFYKNGTLISLEILFSGNLQDIHNINKNIIFIQNIFKKNKNMHRNIKQ